jgi:hypothetical protein
MEQPDLLRKVVEALEELDILYAVVGSVASSAYGEARHTQDVDILVNLRYGDIQPLCSKFPSPEYYVNPEAAMQALRSGAQFNIIESSTGDKADLMIPKYGTWQEQQLSFRRKLRILPDRDVFVARPEDVILSKMRYYKEGGSEKHLRDITGMLKVSPEEIDKEYVRTWAQKLDVTDVWEAILRRLEPG